MSISSLLKTEALCWLRFGKQLDYVCTEGGYWNSDVLGVGPTFSIEVEVKVSIADLRAEFRNKGSKHAYYLSGSTNWAPNYFYFLVPPEIADKAVEIVAEKFPKAGVLVYTGGEARLRNLKRFGEALRSVKKATKLHAAKPTDRFIHAVKLRMGSEMVSLHIAMDALRDLEISKVEALKQDVVDAVKSVEGLTDWEFRADELGEDGLDDPGGGDRPVPAAPGSGPETAS